MENNLLNHKRERTPFDSKSEEEDLYSINNPKKREKNHRNNQKVSH